MINYNNNYLIKYFNDPKLFETSVEIPPIKSRINELALDKA